MPFKNRKTGKELQADIAAQQQSMDVFYRSTLPRKLASVLEEEFAEKSFDREQYPGQSKWQARKKNPKGGRRNLLVDSGKLKGSLMSEIVQGAGTIHVAFGPTDDVVYAAVHNEGGKAGRGKGFQMPKRQLMPIPGTALPPDLQAEIDRYIDDHIHNILS